MTIELARARLRGVYAIVAGAIILLVVPFFEGSILSSTGYLTAAAEISAHHNFGPYLTWVGQNQETDIIFHIVQFLAFLLAFTLPATLRAVLWTSASSRGSLIARLCGQIGFACYALAVVFGLLVSGNSGGSYVNATTTAERASIADHFGMLFAAQNILAHIAGGVLVAVALMVFSARTMRESQKTLPSWLGYLGVLVAALLVITALQFAGEPATSETSVSSLSFLALALWLISNGGYLVRLRSLPGMTGMTAAPSATAASSMSPSASPNSSDAEVPIDDTAATSDNDEVETAIPDRSASDLFPQSGDQSAPE